MPANNLGLWDRWYRDATRQWPYGDTVTYEIGARWLHGLAVEDWGCGLCWFRRYVEPSPYRGIDGTWSRFADEVVSLEHYRSSAEGIFMRHVLEHNWSSWRQILDNALASFTRRMVLVLFTPWAEETGPIAFDRRVRVPDVAFRRTDVVDRFHDLRWTSREGIPVETQYGCEHVFLLERRSHPGAEQRVVPEAPARA